MDSQRFKIWRNPTCADQGPEYMGEFYPPDGHICLYSVDLIALGFAPGSYTVKVPKPLCDLYIVPRWQRIEIR
jgi:hypothetical protein